VRRILDRSDEIAGPPPPHLLNSFGKWWPFIELTPEKKSKIAGLAVELLYNNLSPWKHEVKPEDLKAHLESSGWEFEHICDYCYSEFARHENKSGYIVKDNVTFNYAFQIAEWFPDAKFIYLVRDPRDFALSYKKAPGGPKVAWIAAKQWASEQRKCVQFRDSHPDRCHTIRYEDIVGDPENSVRVLYEFLDLNFSPKVLDPGSSSKEESSSSQYWKNLSKPILAKNSNKYLSEMGKADITKIEAECGFIMKLFGYEIHNGTSAKGPGIVGKAWLTGKDHVVRRIVYRRRMVDAGEYAVRQKRAAIYKQIEALAKS